MSSASVQDLESTLPPVQPLEQTFHTSSSGTTPVLVYNQFAQLNQSVPDSGSAAPGESADSGGEETDNGGSVEIAQGTSSPAINLDPGRPEQGNQGDAASNTGQPEARNNSRVSDRNEQAGGLSEEDLTIVSELSSRDREVRSHEQAHLSVGGIYASAPQFSYERGPDGRNYAVGGEVSIDAGAVAGDPEATIRKLEQVRRAALAPAEPSPQDRRVAAQANQGIIQARADLTEQRQAESEEQREQQRAEAEKPESSSAADRRNNQNRAIQTYQELIGLGEQLTGADAAFAQLDEVI